MLKQRVLTALVLLPLMLGMLFWAPPAVWTAFAALIALLTLREYANMSGLPENRRTPYLAGTAVFMLLAALGGWDLPAAAWLAVVLFWAAVMPLWLYGKWRLNGGIRALAAGWMLVLPFWFALLSLREQGAWALLAVMGLVWVADVGAYFCGKAFGKRKIAPAISPGKTWEGAIGGILCVSVYLTAVRSAGWLGFEASWAATMAAGAVLTAVSIGGDLLESWFKRAAGMKDSSNLLPGHGGVFDRVDSLLAVLAVYAALDKLF